MRLEFTKDTLMHLLNPNKDLHLFNTQKITPGVLGFEMSFGSKCFYSFRPGHLFPSVIWMKPHLEIYSVHLLERVGSGTRPRCRVFLQSSLCPSSPRKCSLKITVILKYNKIVFL